MESQGPLKANVSVSYKVNLGNYQSADFWASREYLQDGTTMGEQLSRLDEDLLAWLDKRGLRPMIVRSGK